MGKFDALLDQLVQTEWVVFTKNWLRKLETVIDFLGRYSRKIALSERRIVGIENVEVQLTDGLLLPWSRSAQSHVPELKS